MRKEEEHMSVATQHGDLATPTPNIQQKIAELGPWFHNIHLPDGSQTRPDHPLGDFPSTKWHYLGAHLPKDLHGWRALDIGCNAGFYTVQLAQRGAHVTAIDVDPHYLAQARWTVQQWGVEDAVTFKQMQIYDLAHTNETFDLVLFMGVFYHLRYPLLGLDIVTQKVKRLMVFQSLSIPGNDAADMTEIKDVNHCEPLRQVGWPHMAFIEHKLANDRTNWWVPNLNGIEAMLRSSGMRVTERLPQELFVCAPDPERPSVVNTWDRAEFLAATGNHSAAQNGQSNNGRKEHTP
jgi:tRNA (mo5U34)-methyltransferase